MQPLAKLSVRESITLHLRQHNRTRQARETYTEPVSMDTIDAIQQRAAERWREKLRAREIGAPSLDDELAADLNEQSEFNPPDVSRGGIEDDLDL